nr:WD repeat-containing protein 91 homolog [Crassostrea gigas]
MPSSINTSSISNNNTSSNSIKHSHRSINTSSISNNNTSSNIIKHSHRSSNNSTSSNKMTHLDLNLMDIPGIMCLILRCADNTALHLTTDSQHCTHTVHLYEDNPD